MNWSGMILEYLIMHDCTPVVIEHTANVLDFSTGKIRHRLHVDDTAADQQLLHMQSFLLKEQSDWACVSTKPLQSNLTEELSSMRDSAFCLVFIQYMIDTNRVVCSTLQELLGPQQ